MKTYDTENGTLDADYIANFIRVEFIFGGPGMRAIIAYMFVSVVLAGPASASRSGRPLRRS